MNTKLFDYKLPKSLIAQEPASPRDSSKLLVLNKDSGYLTHKHFYDLVDFLDKDDVLVLNETKVFPARLKAYKKTGGKVEILLLKQKNDHIWQAIIGGKNIKIGDILYCDKSLQIKVVNDVSGKVKEIKFNKRGASLNTIIDQLGSTPLPPYIKTPDSQKIRESYQTIFAKSRGSAAAPTAGLHFTDRLLKKIKAKGIKIYKITLHVGLGTFEPVTATNIKKHKIHSEWASVSLSTAQALNKLKSQGKNIIAVGTTTTRALEAMTKKNKLQSGSQWVNLYIYPGYKFRFVNSLITNFHLPKSSLLFLVSALAGRKNILLAYKKAVKKKYKFYSFGDAMFIKN